MPIPIELILATCRTVVSYFGKLNPTFVIPVVNNRSCALSPFFTEAKTRYFRRFCRNCNYSVCFDYLPLSMTKVCERKNTINTDQKLATNLDGSFFRCFPSCVAPPRALTIFMKTMEAKTTLNGIFSVAIILLILFFFRDYSIPTFTYFVHSGTNGNQEPTPPSLTVTSAVET